MSNVGPNEYTVLLKIVEVIGRSLQGNDRNPVDILRQDQLANVADVIAPGSAFRQLLERENSPDGAGSRPTPPASRFCHVVVRADTEDERDHAARTLKELGLEPIELFSTAQTVSFRLGSDQPAYVRGLLKEVAFVWAVVAPDASDNLLQALCIQELVRLQPSAAKASASPTIDDSQTDTIGQEHNKAASPSMTPADRENQKRLIDQTLRPEIQSRDRNTPQADPLKLAGCDGHAFISYVREDAAVVERMQQALEAVGVRVWRDTTILLPGEHWRDGIRRAITGDTIVFLACFSRHSLARKKSHQNEELQLAIDQLRIRPPGEPWLIPVRLDDCEIPDHDIGGGRTLGSIQHADLFGDDFEERMASLTATVLQRLRQ